jgi:hypothetical protein
MFGDSSSKAKLVHADDYFFAGLGRALVLVGCLGNFFADSRARSLSPCLPWRRGAHFAGGRAA